MTAADVVPAIEHPLGRHWDQPDPKRIVFDRHGRALMSRRDFEALHNYSTTLPSGVYEGKMWRRQAMTKGEYWNRVPATPERWFVCWYDATPGDPATCTVHSREIDLV